MNKERILEVLGDWNFWRRKPEIGVIREYYLQKFASALKSDMVLAIVGVRRAGKSTLMRQYAKRLIENDVDKKNTLFVNFEDPRFSGNLSLDLMQGIYETYLEYLKPDTKPYIFLDEVQNIKGWERFVRGLHERKAAKIVISGSSASLLSREFGTVLTGRCLIIDVLPLSFAEFLRFNNLIIEDRVSLLTNKVKIRGLLMDYLEWGGFPDVVLSVNKKEILLRYFEDIILRDVAIRHNIRNIEKLRSLGVYYITNISSPTTYNRVRKFLSLPVDTVERFSSYLMEAYLLFFLKRFSYSLKVQERSPRKVYSIDNGLRNVVGFRFSEDIGKLAENIVFLELKNRNREVYYFRDNSQKEVDFVIKEGMKVSELIQVVWDVETAEKREVTALLKAMEGFGLKQGIVITEDYETEKAFDDKRINFIPLWKWLLT